jgi:hypothetical protein
MSPRAGNGAVKVISARFGRKLGLSFVADTFTENRIALEVKPSLVVLDEDILTTPFPVDELSHSALPHQTISMPYALLYQPHHFLRHHAPRMAVRSTGVALLADVPAFSIGTRGAHPSGMTMPTHGLGENDRRLRIGLATQLAAA